MDTIFAKMGMPRVFLPNLGICLIWFRPILVFCFYRAGNPNEVCKEDNLASPQDISNTVSRGEREDGATLCETIESQGGKPEEMSADIFDTYESPKPSCNPNEISEQDSLEDLLPNTSGYGDERKDGVPLSEAIKSRGKKPVTVDRFADYMRKRFRIASIENLTSLRSVTRSGKEYGINAAKELAKKKPACGVPLSNSLKKAKPNKKPVSKVPVHTS